MTVDRAAVVRELAALMCTSHCWRDHRLFYERYDPPENPVPFGEEQLAQHLVGAYKFGLCPVKPGEGTTRVALLDLDSHKGEVGWERMLVQAREIADILRSDGHAPQLWRSSGGQGIHIILTWDSPLQARDVRAYLADVLEFCGLANGTGGVAKKQVEVFPKQDSVPADGFGSMFILPYAGKSEPIE